MPSRNATAPGADKSRGAKEQQSQKKPCTGDNSNVNCKERSKTRTDSGTNPK
jgi:hypothetical protein